MLCACSGEQFRLDEVPQSPESLATRDFSISGLSSRTGEWEVQLEDSQVNDVESTLKETLSLNYEEARALLGRLEYQKGNLDAALQVFQGINVCGLKARMIRAIVEKCQQRRIHSKEGTIQFGVMSMHSVSLLLEAILLKSKSLEGLGQIKEAATECKFILDIVEAALPNGMINSIVGDCKLQEIFHHALTLLPSLWKKASLLDEAVHAYRRALFKPWNLPSQKLAAFQKDLAVLLLYGGIDANLPCMLQQVWGSNPPKNNVEEALVLLCILMRKVSFKEIDWDPEIMDHLAFALSVHGLFELLANHIEELLPGIYYRRERWYLLALCYSAAGQNDVALNLLRKAVGCSERNCKPPLLLLLFGAKLCSEDKRCACDGIDFSQRALRYPLHQGKHFAGIAYRLLGTCYGLCARSCVFDSERVELNKKALNALHNAVMVQENDAELIYCLGLEFALQRNLTAALINATKYLDMVAGSCIRGWKLLAVVVTAEQNYGDAEAIISLAIDESGRWDQLGLIRLKGSLQNCQEQPVHAIETYKALLAMIHAQKNYITIYPNSKETLDRSMEIDAWVDLASIYRVLESWADSNICLDRAKSIDHFSPKYWHEKGKLLEAQSRSPEALSAFAASLSIDPDSAPTLVSAGALLSELGTKALPAARSFLMNALRLDPMNHRAWLNLGRVSRMEGLLLQAADCFQAAYELQQSSPLQRIL